MTDENKLDLNYCVTMHFKAIHFKSGLTYFTYKHTVTLRMHLYIHMAIDNSSSRSPNNTRLK